MTEPVVVWYQGELTADVVAKWFPESRYGQPSPDQCRSLTAELNEFLPLAPGKDGFYLVSGPEDLFAAHHKQILQISKAALALKREFEALHKLPGSVFIGRHGCTLLGGEKGVLLKAVDEFLECLPARAPGAPKAGWHTFAAMWAPKVADLLHKPSLPPPSLYSGTGPVTTVVSKILFHCLGVEIPPEAIGRRLHERKVTRHHR